MSRSSGAKAGDERTRGSAFGVTGGIACGKSEVGHILQTAGVEVLDADTVAHDLMRRGQAVYEAVIERFGKGILDDDGEVERRKLSKIVFSDENGMRALNELVHPATRATWRSWVEKETSAGKNVAVIIPLLFEVGEIEPWDAVICVTANDANVRERLNERGLGAEDIDQRIAAQWPVAEKTAKADFVIENDGTIEELKKTTMKVLKELLNRERAHHG